MVDTIWSEAQRQLRGALAGKDFEFWIAPLRVAKQETDDLTLEVASQFARSHLPIICDQAETARRHVREKYPHINVHGFSPPEFNHFAEVFGMPLREVIAKFKEAGLGSIPGGGGEILVDRVRDRISPLKCNSDQWLEVMRIAHELGLNSSATMMFGHGSSQT